MKYKLFLQVNKIRNRLLVACVSREQLLCFRSSTGQTWLPVQTSRVHRSSSPIQKGSGAKQCGNSLRVNVCFSSTIWWSSNTWVCQLWYKTVMCAQSTCLILANFCQREIFRKKYKTCFQLWLSKQCIWLRSCEETRDGWSEWQREYTVSVLSGVCVSFARIFAVCTLGNKALYVKSVDQGAGGWVDRETGRYIHSLPAVDDDISSWVLHIDVHKQHLCIFHLNKSKDVYDINMFSAFLGRSSWLVFLKQTKNSRFYQDKWLWKRCFCLFLLLLLLLLLLPKTTTTIDNVIGDWLMTDW